MSTLKILLMGCIFTVAACSGYAADLPTGYFKLQSQHVESKGLFLESNHGSDTNSTLGGATFMSGQSGNPTGTKWKMVPVR